MKAGSTGDGSLGNPYGTIQDAVDNIKTATRIYVCGGDTFNGSIELPAGVSIYGGLACADWTYASTNTRPTIHGDPNVPALRILGQDGSSLASLRIEAPDADSPGESSIGVVIGQATVDLVNVGIAARKGAAGAAPPAQEDQLGQAQGGMSGANAGTDPVTNAMGGANTCNADALTGGNGGSGGPAPNNSGGNGVSGDVLLGAGGDPGIGQTGATFNCVAGQGLGGGGGSGDPANSGNGATTTQGSINEEGFTPADGEPGDAGTHGHSGGGGGGSRASGSVNGAGGGGGGAGGCGGHGGPGGKGGGSSIALLSIDATVTLGAGVQLVVGAGGNGGDGGKGQFGQPGGNPGMGGPGAGAVVAACFGGSGGPGGTGGNGGGGRGGHAIGIAFVGPEPTGGTIDIGSAMGGEPGGGGDNGSTPAGGVGGTGIVEERHEF